MEQAIEERSLNAVLDALSYAARSEHGSTAAAPHDSQSAATQLEDARVLMQMLLDHFPEGIAVAYGPPNFPIVATNRRLEELTGLRRRDLLGIVAGPEVHNRRWSLSNGDTGSGADELPLYRALRCGETLRNEELVVVGPDGTRTDVLVDAVPIRTPSGCVVGAVTCWRDITNMKRAQHALQVVEAQLRDADLRKDEFLGILAHELRGPVSPISNAVHMLKMMASGEPKLYQIADILDRQVNAISRLLDDLLDLSRVTRGKLSLNMEPVEIIPVINQAVEWNRAAIDSKGQHLVVIRPQSPIVVNGDSVRLAQVVSNLLANAAKFTDSGGRIWITAEIANKEAIVRVRDTGPGLEASDLNNIFDLFYQLERTVDRNGRGLGIGLSLVRRLVEMHGGRVEVFSEGRGCGSDFVFHLPLLSATDASGPGRFLEIAGPRESVLDHALEATFPASDPLSVTQPGGGRQPQDATVGHEIVSASRTTCSGMIVGQGSQEPTQATTRGCGFTA